MFTEGSPGRALGTREEEVHVSWVAPMLPSTGTTGFIDCELIEVKSNYVLLTTQLIGIYYIP